MAETSAVVIERVSKRYGAGHAAVPALSDVHLTVPRGEFLSIMGPSGCGKSTLLNLIAGLDTPDVGRVIVDGRDLAAMSDDERSDLRLHRLPALLRANLGGRVDQFLAAHDLRRTDIAFRRLGASFSSSWRRPFFVVAATFRSPWPSRARPKRAAPAAALCWERDGLRRAAPS